MAQDTTQITLGDLTQHAKEYEDGAALFHNLLDTFVNADMRKSRLWCEHQ